MTRMINKKEVLYLLGISATSPARKKVFKDLPKYENPYSKVKVFKIEDVEKLMNGFKAIS